MNPAVIAAWSASIAIPASLHILSRMFPSTTPAVSTLTMAELKAKYYKWNVAMGPIMIGVAAPLTGLFWLIFKTISGWCASLLPPADITFAPMVPIYWLFPAMIIALSCSGFAAIAIIRWMLGARYPEFLVYWSNASSMDPIKTNKIVLAGAAGLGAIIVFLGLRPYVQLRGHELVVKGYFSAITRHYPLTEIQHIRTATRFIAHAGNVVKRREYVITFTANRQWDTSFIPSDPDAETKRKFMETLSKRAHVPIEQVAMFAKGVI